MRAPTLLFLSGLTGLVAGGSLDDIEHVVLFMQENRAFDHYFGTMSGVRGFSDPNVQVNDDGLSTFQQLTYGAGSAETLNPWYLAYEGGNWTDAAQCAQAGSNAWQQNHAALHGGLNNRWVPNCTAYAWAHFQRDDIPTHFSIAEGWTVADMYQESLIAATNPNRLMWMSGSVNVPGGHQTLDQGGVVLDNYQSPGCEDGRPNLNCFPLKWTTFPEYLQDAGVSWQVYQDRNNFDDNRLTVFTQYQNAPDDSPLTKYGNSFIGLDRFYADARAGTLPQVSWIIGPQELSEHPPWLPKDGAWLQEQVVRAVTEGASYNDTVLMISYDETGGWGDHVSPFHSPSGTAGEWFDDPYGNEGNTFGGPGFRVPFYIISPWTTGGQVFTEHADHVSQWLFVEKWLAAKGFTGVQTKEISDWRRSQMSDLVGAFDFDHPDLTLPKIVAAPTPHTNPDNGKYDGLSNCQALYGKAEPTVPYGDENSNSDPSALSEEGFKSVRGYLTEGRYLVFEMNGFALAAGSNASNLTTSPATDDHKDVKQRWIVHATGGSATAGGPGSGTFTVQSASDAKAYLGTDADALAAKDAAGEWEIADLGNAKGYSIARDGKYLSIAQDDGALTMGSEAAAFKVYSVTYHS